MNLSPKSAAPLVLSLLLAACGGAPEETGDSAAPLPAETATANTAAAAAADAAPAVDGAPAPAETADESPAATPGPAATPATVAAAAAAPAGPPQAFAVCAACHKAGPGEHGLGPSLAGVFNARAGHASGFDYSQPMLDSGLTWNQANLDRYLEDPRGTVPGTTMAFAGVKDAARRQAIIDYLKGL